MLMSLYSTYFLTYAKHMRNLFNEHSAYGGKGVLVVICSVSFSDDEFVSTNVKNHPIANFIGHCVTYENVDRTSHEWFWTSCTASLHPLCEQPPAEGNEYVLKECNRKHILLK